MAEEATPQGQEPEKKAPEAAPSKPEPARSEPKTFDEDYVKELRAEAAKHRKEAQEAKAKITEFEDRDKSEVEKAQKKLSQAQETDKARAETEKQLRVRVAVLEAAHDAGITDTKAAAKLLDESQIEYEDGIPTNVPELLKKLSEEYPALVSEPKPTPRGLDGGVREPAPESTTPEQDHDQLLVSMLTGQRQP